MQENEGAPTARRTAVTRGAAWTGTVAILGSLIQIAVIATLARILSPAEFGVVSAAGLLVSVAQTMSLSNIIPPIIRDPTFSEEAQRSAATFCICLGLFFFVALELLAPVIEAALKIEGTANVVRVLAIIFPIRSVGVVSEALAMKRLAFRSLAMRELLSYAIGYALVAVVLASLGAGYWAIVAAQIGQVVLSTLLILRVVPPKIGTSGFWSSLPALGRLSSGYSGVMLLLHLAATADNFIVGRLLGPTALGLYGRAYQLMAFPSTIFGKVSQSVLFPAFSQAQRNGSDLARAYRRSIEITALVGLPLTAGLFILAEDVIRLLLGDAWISMVPTFQILSLTLYFRLAQKASQAVMRSTGTLRQELFLQSSYLIGIVVGSIVGARFGIAGVAAGVCFVTTAHSVAQSIVVCRLVRLPIVAALFAHAVPLLSTAVVAATLLISGHFLPISLNIPFRFSASVILVFLTMSAAAYLAPQYFLGEASTYVFNGLLNRSKDRSK